MIEIIALLKQVTAGLEQKNIPYMLSGGIAMNAYTDSRATRDIDIIIELQEHEIDSLLDIFKTGFYFSKEAIKVEVKRKGMFNIIDTNSGFKIDFVLKKNFEYRVVEFQRKRRASVLGVDAWLVSPEDLIISKLLWIQDLYSDRQAGDIKSLLPVPNLDLHYIRKWSKELNLKTFNLLDT